MCVGLINKYVSKSLNNQGKKWKGKSFIQCIRCSKEVETLDVKGTKILICISKYFTSVKFQYIRNIQ